jgi:hypothetical protein
MAIQRFDDGTSAVSFAGSHLVLDGMGALRAIEAAANRIEVPGSYMTQGTRGWLTGCLSDARQILADTPRTLVAIAKITLSIWRKPSSPMQRKVIAADARQPLVELPAIAVTIDAQVWDACAQRLGGRAISLLLGFVATLAARIGRCRTSDRTINLLVPIDRRAGLSDERALAIEFRTVIVAPEGLTKDLRPLNAPIKALLRGAKNNGIDALAALLPAVSWLPRNVSMAIMNQLFDYADQRPVSCSNLGMLPETIARIDGAPCTRFLTRAVDVEVTRRDLERSHGHLVVVASRMGKLMSLCIEGYHLEPALTTTDELRQVTAQTLADFGLEGFIDT